MIDVIVAVSCVVLGFTGGWLLHRYTTRYYESRERQELQDRLTSALQGEAVAQARMDEQRHQIENEREQIRNLRVELENTFKALAGEIARSNTENFLKLATDRFSHLADQAEGKLSAKKELIDQNLAEMKQALKGLSEQSIQLNSNLEQNRSETEKLRGTASQLREVLSSSQTRGQWGERMVEDILQMIGLLENVNYRKQTQVTSGEKPDYTFLLPRDKVLNMDVKFPLVHYERYLGAENDHQEEEEKILFLKDVKHHVKAVASRTYINPADGTLDYVMLFIPNEAIYGFINREDPQLVDYALSHKVLLCSPLTLYAVLSLIHQATRSFAMEQKAAEVLDLLAVFRTQWEKFTDSLSKMGRRIDDAQKEFQTLSSTRSRQLERPLLKIDELTQGESSLISPED